MYKQCLLFILLIFVWVSCVLPTIVYSLEDIQPSVQDDLIGLELIKGETRTTGGKKDENYYSKTKRNKMKICNQRSLRQVKMTNLKT